MSEHMKSLRENYLSLAKTQRQIAGQYRGLAAVGEATEHQIQQIERLLRDAEFNDEMAARFAERIMEYDRERQS